MDTPKPHLLAALICERVLQEKDGSLSVIRIADKVIYEVPEEAPEGARPVFSLAGLLVLKSGLAKGTYSVKLVANSPSGKQQELPPTAVSLEGEDQGQNVILNLHLGLKEDGLYWFDVIFENDVLTRIPLSVERVQKQKSEKK